MGCLASQPYEYAHSFGWGAALILILLVLGLSLGLRLVAHKRGFKIGTIAATTAAMPAIRIGIFKGESSWG